ncbi:hypothetical protein BT67DRAFT_442641 [Trichocladium antarcticum]|uniref:Uncharacterized protein n=1 Tax=Trichocladium antarcticum TaxID=1450529 RepID=A0AAN6UJ88_9PEZI|nr:hypothetical protein BT67DRAFT_442641 [Trichocladium antarcticum]
MQTVWVVGDVDQIVQLPLSVSRDYFDFGGPVYGNATHTPMVNHFFDGASRCDAAMLSSEDGIGL